MVGIGANRLDQNRFPQAAVGREHFREACPGRLRDEQNGPVPRDSRAIRAPDETLLAPAGALRHSAPLIHRGTQMRLIVLAGFAALLASAANADTMAHCAAAWKAKTPEATAAGSYKAWDKT